MHVGIVHWEDVVLSNSRAVPASFDSGSFLLAILIALLDLCGAYHMFVVGHVEEADAG